MATKIEIDYAYNALAQSQKKEAERTSPEVMRARDRLRQQLLNGCLRNYCIGASKKNKPLPCRRCRRHHRHDRGSLFRSLQDGLGLRRCATYT